MLQIFLISLILSLDALSVCIAGGIKSKSPKPGHALIIAAVFGSFQAVMPVFGWLVGEGMKLYIVAVDHWLAFILLSAVGLKMIQGGLSRKNKGQEEILNGKVLFLLGVVTSIDAFIIGITLSLAEIPFLLSVITIGAVTFILSFLGYLLGQKIGKLFGKKVELLGGALLLIIGAKILIEHLFA